MSHFTIYYSLMSLIPSYDANIITDKIQFSIKFYTEVGRHENKSNVVQNITITVILLWQLQ